MANSAAAPDQARDQARDQAAVEKLYTEVVQHLKPWTPAPPKVRDDETASADGRESDLEIVSFHPGQVTPVDEYAASP